MKKTLITILAALATFASQAQNIQVHYDFGRTFYSSEQPDRQKVTITLEQFKADRLGSWYYFVDVDVKSAGATGGYTEISREFNFKQNSPFAAHIEFNGGLNLAGSFQNAALAGVAYNWHNSDFTRTWSLQALYKQHFKSGDLKAVEGFQLTTVWGMEFLNRKLTFSGFIDLWNGYIPSWKADGRQKKGLIFATEPQLWYNFSKHFSAGTEVEISNNFIYHSASTTTTFYVNPTLAVKFTL